MPESPTFTVVPSILGEMRAELDQAVAGGHKPIEWLVRLEMLTPLCERARDEGVLSGEIAHIHGIKVRGSWKSLNPGELPVLVCEGDEYHRAILDMYSGR